jgi:hypothetical protein
MNADGQRLTSESRRLLSDISQHVLRRTDNIDIQHLPDDIHAAFIRDRSKTVKNMHIPSPQITYPSAQIDSPATFSFKDIPAPIVQLINTELKKEMRWDLVMPQTGAKVSLRFFVGEVEPSADAVKDCITWLYMMYNKGAGVGCKPPKELVCWFYLTSAQKVVGVGGAGNNVLSAIHANTAFTRTCVPVNEIVIYRAEEWFKVFIHESIHTFGLDFSDRDDAALKTCADLVRRRLGLNSKNTEVNVYEAYTEFWAEIINILFIAGMRPLHVVDAMIALETAFSVGQMHKVLGEMGLTIRDLITRSPAVSAQYRENTSILSYYVLKTIILCNMGEFLRNRGQGQKDFIEYVNFGDDVAGETAFCDFVTAKEGVVQCAKAVAVPIPNTMRMTVWEKN